MMRQPVFYIPHGGGPCFFMDDPAGTWTGMEAFLRTLPSRLPERPRAILMISGHWESEGRFLFTGSAKPDLLFDYYGFPQHTYELRYDAPGEPEIAARALDLMEKAGLPAGLDTGRGLDHGVFVPLKVAFPDADIPVIEMSLDRHLDPALHIGAGRALAPLRDEGVVIVTSGMSFHNMRGYGDARFTEPSEHFDHWLSESVALEPAARDERLRAWESAPGARQSHPREEHLIPLFIAAGAADGPGEQIYRETVMKTVISGFAFA